MKKIIYLIILTLAVFSSCKDMDNMYREYVVPDGIVYPQRTDSLKIYPGLERVKLTWLGAKDPKVVRATVYWNNYTDSLGVNIPAGRDTVSVIIENLEEGVYTFHVKTFDADGNVSIPTEVTGTVYGANYALTLSPRPVTINAYYDRAELNWGAISNTVTKVAIRYESSSGSVIERNIPLDETLTPIADYKPGGAISVMTYHTPSPTALDPVILTNEMTFPDVYELNKQGWSIVVSDSLLRADTPGGIGAIDGDINVMWHSNLDLYYPHWLEI
ncbi:MAG: DUF4998 domain-containing protein, partial [Prevotellaceae bacterium]|nr:DUF4998 domain-containing protein [Prevotellaceae bacterium]